MTLIGSCGYLARMVQASRGAVTTALALALVAGSGAGCSLILEFSELPDAGDTTDAADLCAIFEPNNDFASATMLETDEISAAICNADPADRDFFQFTVPSNQDVTVTMTMADGSGAGSLGLRLLDSAEGVVDVSDTFVDEEVIQQNLGAGDYTIEVFGTASVNTNNYTLAVALTNP